VLHAHRDAHQVVRQPPGRPHLSRDGGMAHVARQANAAGHTAEADGDLEQLGLLCYNLTCLHTAHPKPKSANKIHIYMYIYILIIDYVY